LAVALAPAELVGLRSRRERGWRLIVSSSALEAPTVVAGLDDIAVVSDRRPPARLSAALGRAESTPGTARATPLGQNWGHPREDTGWRPTLPLRSCRWAITRNGGRFISETCGRLHFRNFGLLYPEYARLLRKPRPVKYPELYGRDR
jgi:hypothetical protein